MVRTPLVAITPDVLRWARVDSGGSMSELGRLVGVSAARVDEWEQGASQPTLAQLRHVADALRRPVAFFLTPAPPSEHLVSPTDFRASAAPPSRALRAEIRRAVERRDGYRELVAGEALPWRAWLAALPTSSDDVRTALGVRPEVVAATTDANAALKLWVRALESHGVLVFQMSGIPVDECRGFALADDDLPVIVLNGADAPQARAFTALHELAHLLDGTAALCLLDDDLPAERRCNRFAAEVLMPAAAVRSLLAARPAGAVDLVCRAFRVSLMAAAIRLRELDLVSAAVVAATGERAREAALVAASRSGRGPAPHVLKRRNVGDRYASAVLDAVHQEAITLLDATYMLDTTVNMLARIDRDLAASSA